MISFKLGKFYELFYDDSIIGNKLLELFHYMDYSILVISGFILALLISNFSFNFQNCNYHNNNPFFNYNAILSLLFLLLFNPILLLISFLFQYIVLIIIFILASFNVVALFLLKPFLLPLLIVLLLLMAHLLPCT